MIDNIPILALSPAALLSVVVLMILTGKLIPKAYFEVKSQESERWRLAFETEREARMLSDLQTNKLLEQSQAAQVMLTAIYNKSERLSPLVGDQREVS